MMKYITYRFYFFKNSCLEQINNKKSLKMRVFLKINLKIGENELN